MKGVYAITKTICNERPRQVDSVRDKHGRLLTKEGEVGASWKEHFCEVLNRPDLPEQADGETNDVQDMLIYETPPPYEEIRTALRELRNGKHYHRTLEPLRTDIETSTKQVQELVRRAWTGERHQQDGKEGLS